MTKRKVSIYPPPTTHPLMNHLWCFHRDSICFVSLRRTPRASISSFLRATFKMLVTLSSTQSNSKTFRSLRILNFLTNLSSPRSSHSSLRRIALYSKVLRKSGGWSLSFPSSSHSNLALLLLDMVAFCQSGFMFVSWKCYERFVVFCGSGMNVLWKCYECFLEVLWTSRGSVMNVLWKGVMNVSWECYECFVELLWMFCGSVMNISGKCYRGSVTFYELIFECVIAKVLISTFHGSVPKDFLSLWYSVEGVESLWSSVV